MNIPLLDIVLNMARKRGWKHRTITYDKPWHNFHYVNRKAQRIIMYIGTHHVDFMRQRRIRITTSMGKRTTYDNIRGCRIDLHDPDSFKAMSKVFK